MPPAEHRPAAEAPAETVRPAAKAPTEREQPTATETEAPAKVNVPQRPQVISPAGPQLKQPERTKLAGPKVIRVESPEPVAAPQPRRGGRSDSGPVGRGGPRGGRGVGPEPPGAPPRGRGGGSSRRNKRRSATARPESGRTGRSGGLGSGDQDRGFNWREQDLLERERRLNRSAGFIRAARRDNLKRTSGTGGQKARAAVDTGGKVKVEEPITIKNLSAATGVKVNDIIRQLVRGGDMVANADAVLDTEKAMELMLEYNVELEVVEQKTAEEQIAEQFAEREMIDERPRSPVVTILGHVDHGKTSLLDRIRQTNVAEGEAGGITQATSAFRVPVRLGEGDRMITFIDTPGHEAFTEMRSRGAQVTDIVVLVVAADDGVMPQTVESINHAKAASVPIIVALNKIDKPEATDSNIQRILGQLTEHELNPVEWGGSTEVVRTSAVKDEGLQDLLETLDFQAQLLELTADYGGQAEGTVIEAQMEEGRGAVARLLVQQGQMNQGDFVVVGRAYGRVRDIVSDRGERIKEAGPCTPVAISGIDEVPDAGDKFYVVKSLRDAEAAAQERRQQERERELAKEKVTLDNIFEKLSEQGRKELPLIVKADVQGSLETLKSTLAKIGSEEVVVSIKHAAVGGVNESDVGLAEASGAIIVGFNVTSSGAARRAAEARGVDIRFYDVIYDLTDDVTKAAEGLLEPELKLEVLGHAEVRDVFKVSKVGMIAGCYVTEGTIERHAQIRVTREDIVVEKDRRLEQLKRFKDDVKEVHAGQECGMRIEGYDDIRVGDILECYKTREVRRSL
jgi:translation initiation factor IF-2